MPCAVKSLSNMVMITFLKSHAFTKARRQIRKKRMRLSGQQISDAHLMLCAVIWIMTNSAFMS